MFAHCLCRGEKRTVVVLYWQNLAANSLYSTPTLSLCMSGLAALFVFHVGAGCSCSVHKAASHEDLGKKKYAKKSVVISNKQQGHITTCNGKPQRNASETKIFFREAAESLDLHSGRFDPNQCFAHPTLVQNHVQAVVGWPKQKGVSSYSQ